MKRYCLYALVLFVTTVLPGLHFEVQAQGRFVATTGQTRQYSVEYHPSNTYFWTLYDEPGLTHRATADEAKILFETDQPKLSVQWNKPGVYYLLLLESNPIGCVNKKVIAVTVSSFDLSVYAGSDTIIGACSSITLKGSLSVKGASGFVKWKIIGKNGQISNSDSLTPTFVPDGSGDYTIVLIATALGEIVSDTVKIRVDKAPVAVIDIGTATNRFVTLNGSVSAGKNLTYHWSTTDGEILGSPLRTVIEVQKPGTYQLTVTDQYGCTAIKSVVVNSNRTIQTVDDLGRTSWLDPLQVDVLQNDIVTNSAIQGAVVTLIQKPEFGTAVVNNDGTITYTAGVHRAVQDRFLYRACIESTVCDSARVTIDVSNPPLQIPEGFSPNGDGINDKFEVKGLENYPDSKLAVYDRSGQLIYQSDNYQSAWDGRNYRQNKSSDQKVPTGVYYYVLRIGDTGKVIKGYVFVSY